MNRILKISIYISLLTTSIFCNSTVLPNDIRWVVSSEEYKQLCEQIYDHATYVCKIKGGFYKSNSMFKKPAIVMDLDETVLNNSQYQVEIFNKGESFNMESWADWVLREEATLVPGSKEFIDFIRSLDIQIIFISNRMDERVEATKSNMKKLGIYNSNDIYLLRLDKADKKSIRRNEVIKGINRMKNYGSFDVMAYLGDAKGDFPNETSTNFFIFPNPMYGKC